MAFQKSKISEPVRGTEADRYFSRPTLCRALRRDLYSIHASAGPRRLRRMPASKRSQAGKGPVRVRRYQGPVKTVDVTPSFSRTSFGHRIRSRTRSVLPSGALTDNDGPRYSGRGSAVVSLRRLPDKSNRTVEPRRTAWLATIPPLRKTTVNDPPRLSADQPR